MLSRREEELSESHSGWQYISYVLESFNSYICTVEFMLSGQLCQLVQVVN